MRSKKHNPSGYAKVRNLTNNGKHLAELNRRLNPTRMTHPVRAKLRQARLGTGEGKSYEKTYGRHTHRIVAEQNLGRPLQPGEVVHHIDGNKRNNHPGNLQVMTQSEHARIHWEQGDFRKKSA